MRLAASVTRAARRALDLLLLLVIAAVLATLVIARVVPALTGGATLVVGGHSMEPAIPIGSAVVVVPVDPAALRVGDVVSVRVGPERAVFTHRIERLVERADGLWIATRGDANASPDPSIVPATSVIGRVEFTAPVAGYAVTLLGTPQGVVFVISLAGCLLAAAWLLETLEDDQRAGLRRAAGTAAARAGDSQAEPGAAAG